MREGAIGMMRRLGIIAPVIHASVLVQIQKHIFCLMIQSMIPYQTRFRKRASTVGVAM
jgi:hypothetical protein